jgi:hypothetical protein
LVQCAAKVCFDALTDSFTRCSKNVAVWMGSLACDVDITAQAVVIRLV